MADAASPETGPTGQLSPPSPPALDGPSVRELHAELARLTRAEGIALLREDQERRWLRGEHVSVESYLAAFTHLRADEEGVLDLIYQEVLLREQAGERPGLEEYLRRFPQYEVRLRRQFDLHQVLSDGSLVGLTERPTHAGDPAALEGSLAASPDSEVTGPGVAPAEAGTAPAVRVTISGPVREVSAPTVPGFRIGSYEVMGELGRGGMGVVYKARQVRLNRLVAVKMIPGSAAADPEWRGRFQAEAEAVARLQHPNIVQVFEVGEHQGQPFFSLELMEGGGLDRKLAGNPQPPAEAARLVETLARAVHHAHQKGIVHRDLKPANVLLAADGTPKVTDFGLAKQVDAGPGQTRSGVILGTPSYMAPEQAAGKASELGPACDVYGLGAVLYDLLTGRPPFRAASAWDTISQVITEDPVPPRRLHRQVPRDLETICLKCLRKEPHKRYASAEALADDLRRFLAGEPIQARPVGRLERGALWAKRRPLVAGLLAATCVLALTGSGLVLWQWLRAEAEGRDARAHAAAEEVAKARAEAELRKAEASLYVVNLTWAEREWSVNRDVGRTRERLAECKPALRHWEWYYLHRLSQGGLLTLREHQGPVTCAAYSPDGRLLASGGADGTVRVWDAGLGRGLHVLHAAGQVGRVHFSRDGRRLACVCRRGGTAQGRYAVTVWDVATGGVLFATPEDGRCVALSPDGRRVAAAVGETRVKVWDVATGKEACTLARHALPVLDLAFSPDGERLAAATGHGARGVVGVVIGGDRPGAERAPPAKELPPRRPGEVKLWEVATGKEVRTFRGHTASVLGVTFSPDGARLATASEDQTARVWDATTGSTLSVHGGHADTVRSVAFSPDGRHVVSAGDDGAVRVCDAATGKAVLVLAGQPGAAPVVAFDPSGCQLATAGAGRRGPAEISIWQLGNDRPLRTFRGHTGRVCCFAFAPNGTRLASASADGTVQAWDVTADQEGPSLPGADGPVAFSPDGALLATGGADGLVKLWDGRTRREVRALAGHTAGVRALAFSPDGRRLASSARDFGEPGEIILWDVEAGKRLRTLPDQPGVANLAFHPRRPLLALPGEGGAVRTWDVEAASPPLTLQGQVGPVGGLAFGRDGLLAAGGGDGAVRLWDEGGGLAKVLRGPRAGVQDVAFSGDGRRLAAAGKGPAAKVVLWDVTTGKELLALQAPAPVTALALSRDGRRISTGDVSGGVRIWDADAGQQLLRLPGHGGAVLGLALRPDGHVLVSAGADGTVRVWDASPPSAP